jgi:hypothetical protein
MRGLSPPVESADESGVAGVAHVPPTPTDPVELSGRAGTYEPSKDDSFVPLEDVFKTIGIPTYTFVEPFEYRRLLVALRTASKPLVVEGPSGIGKTTAVVRALNDLQMTHVQILRARVPADVEIINELPDILDRGIVLIDDFHVLPDSTKRLIADFIKVLIDESRTSTKVIVLGISEAGRALINFAPDLTGRIDRLRMESNKAEKVEELLALGEKALNIRFENRRELAEESIGSFQLGQMIGFQSCMSDGVTQRSHELISVSTPVVSVRGQILDEISPGWSEAAYVFARGQKFRPSGRAPYLRLLYWLSKSGGWSLDVKKAIDANPEHKFSVGQIIEKGYLSDFLRDKSKELGKFVHFDTASDTLSVEDPKAYYYLRHISWPKFVRASGFARLDFKSKYDFALSFAGADRDLASAIADALKERELQVFYDFDEADAIAGADLEKYLAPIYASESELVLALIGPEYPRRVWTKFESDQFKARFGEGRVVPIFISGFQPSFFDEFFKVGGFSIIRDATLEPQIKFIAEALSKKIVSFRVSQAAEDEGGAGAD